MNVSTRIFAALVVGAAAGLLARMSAGPGLRDAFYQLEPVGIIFIRLMNLVIVPLVVSSLFVGIASLGDVRRLGRIGGRTLAWFGATTAAAAIIGLTVALVTGIGRGADPGILTVEGSRETSRTLLPAENVPATPQRPGWVQSLIDLTPQNPIAAASQTNLLSLVIAVCLFGAAATVVSAERRRPVVAFLEGVRDVSMVVIGWVMQVAPVAVLVLIAATVARSGTHVLGQLILYMAVVIVALAMHVALVLVPALRLGARLGIWQFWRASSDAMLLAFGTASSTGALPVSLAAADRLKIPADVAGFALPTGTTVNKNGAAVYKAVTAVFIAHLSGLPLGPLQWLTIAAASTAAAFTGAGVPGSSLVTTAMVLNALGPNVQTAAGLALVAGVDRPLDMCRTMVNTAGNLVGAAVVGKTERSAAAGLRV